MANISPPDPDYYDKCRRAVEEKDHLPLVVFFDGGEDMLYNFTRLFSVDQMSPLRDEELDGTDRMEILAEVAMRVRAEGVREMHSEASDL